MSLLSYDVLTDNDNDNESMFIVKVVQNQNQIINNAST